VRGWAGALVRLNTSTEAADIRLFEAQLREANQQMARIQPLVQSGTLAKAALDRAVAARDSARAQVERARADLGKRVITAPFSGRLGIRQVQLGQYLNPGDPIVSLQAIDPIYVTFNLPEQKLGRVRAGQPVSVASDAYPGRIFTGQVTTVDARIDPASRNLMVQATLPNGDGALAPGMFANVTLANPQGAGQVVAVPETALSYSLSGDSVWVLKPSQTANVFLAEQRAVKVGTSAEGWVEIQTGVKPGERVVTAGQNKLRAGGEVMINNAVSLAKPTTLARE
jgi:membrane fusion protein, multidrug efflux system